MASSINASTTAGVVTTADTSGVLNIQTAGTTAIAIDASQAVTMAGRTSNPTTISVGGATPSTSGAGITFPATQSASTDANTLDDYEEGTWTIGIAFGGASVGITYGATSGSYVRVGRQVTVTGIVILTNKGSSVGAATLTGLPFTNANTAAAYAAVALRFSNITFAGQVQAYTNIGTTTISFENVSIAGVTSGLTNTNFANNSDVLICVTYFV